MRSVIIAAALVGVAGGTLAAPVGTGFTYQGYIELSDRPLGVSDDEQLTFRLYDAESGGNQVGAEIAKAPGEIIFSEGLFSTELDFGASVHDGTQLWLEIEVDGNILSPRQKLTGAPHSLSTRGISVNGSGSVGIGTNDPADPLHVVGRLRSSGDGAGLTVFNPANQNASVNFSWLDSVARFRVGGNGAGANGGFDFQRIGDASLLRILDNGSVGIGTTNPVDDLHIDGGDATLRLSSSPAGTWGSLINLSEFSGGTAVNNWGIWRTTSSSDSSLRFRFDPTGDSNHSTYMTISADGNVGIGTTVPGKLLAVNGTAGIGILAVGPFPNTSTTSAPLTVNGSISGIPSPSAGAATLSHSDGSGFPGQPPATALPTVRISRSFGLLDATALTVSAPNTAAEFTNNSQARETIYVENDTQGTAIRAQSVGTAAGVLSVGIVQPGGTIGGSNIIVCTNELLGGNVARIDRTGRGFFNGGTQTGGADVAEWFAVEGNAADYGPGDLLAISVDVDRTVTLSSEPYCTLVAGVHATRPGILLTERHVDADHSDMVPMGVVGVVPTKVSAENGPIRRGDLLVSSSTPGHAMKGTDRDRMLGAIIGKALADFDGPGTGVIRVMVTTK
jgi:hypothetical protein